VRLCLLCRYGQYPLHKAIDHACPESMNVIALLLELYPAAAKVADQDGYLPLHVCLDSRNPDEDLVEQLLIAFPDAAKRPTVDGLLPLHMAIGILYSRIPRIPAASRYGLSQIVLIALFSRRFLTCSERIS
jgi:hypothetical protein